MWLLKYNDIINAIQEAKKQGDDKALKRAMRRLERWQLGYGAYSPVQSVGLRPSRV